MEAWLTGRLRDHEHGMIFSLSDGIHMLGVQLETRRLRAGIDVGGRGTECPYLMLALESLGVCVGSIPSLTVLCEEVSNKLAHVDGAHFADCKVDVTRQVVCCRGVVADPMRVHRGSSLGCSTCVVTSLVVLASIDEFGAFEDEWHRMLLCSRADSCLLMDEAVCFI